VEKHQCEIEKALSSLPAWINPEEYRRFIAGQKRAFEDQVDKELGVPKEAPKPQKESLRLLNLNMEMQCTPNRARRSRRRTRG
jgi:hypothetical protein